MAASAFGALAADSHSCFRKAAMHDLPYGLRSFRYGAAAGALLRRCKHGYVWRLPLNVCNGIAPARVQTSAMASNTCCTALLVQGTIESPP